MMARRRRPPLTERQVARLAAPARGRAELVDGQVDRLVLRVTPRGVKTWSVLYQSPVTMRQERLTIGRHPGVSLRVARQRAKLVHAQVAMGRCPRTEQREAQPGGRPATFAEVAAEYLAQQRGRIDSWRNIDSCLRNHLLPAWGSRRVDSVRQGDVHLLLDRLVAQGRRGAAREVRKHVHAILRWAHSRELVASNVAYSLHLPELRRRRGEDAGRALEDAELAAVWRAAGRLGYPWAPLFRLILLTGCRRTEIAELRWSEVDFRGEALRLAPERTKSRRGHVVPLAPAALEQLRSCPRLVGPEDPAVFSCRGGAVPVHQGSFAKAKRALDAEVAAVLGQTPPRWRIHDLRVTCRTRMARLGVPREVAEAVLGHAPPSGLVRVYDKHDYQTEARAALERYAEHLREVLEEARAEASS